MNEALTNLDETSPSKVVKQVFEKIESFDKSTAYTVEEKDLLSTPTTIPPTFNKKIHLQFDNKQQRYPLTAQYVSKYIIEKILSISSASTLPNTWVDIHSLCNTQSITKYGIAYKFYEYLMTPDKHVTCDQLTNRMCPVVNNFIFENTEAKFDDFLPHSEQMDRDPYLDKLHTDISTHILLDENNIMESIQQGFIYYTTNDATTLKSTINSVVPLPP